MPSPTPRSRLRAALAASLLGATALGGVAAFQAVHPALAQTTGAPGSAPVNAPAAIQPVAPATMPDFVNLVVQVKPAVVQITTTLAAQPAADSDDDDAPGQEGPQASPFGGMPFGGMPFGMIPGHPPMQAHPVEARGSGFIIDPNGTIVTNNHVVRGAKSVSVTLDDGTELPARIIGRDPRSDLAVLRVDAGRKLPYIQLGDSSKVRPGEWVVAMGNPFGLGGTVTAGIVSSTGRDIGEGPYDNFIQIDAPINRGNSGGPLFTQDGRVVGVNTAILSPSGGSIGIGFAIPSNMVRSVVDQLEASGHVTRGYLGVELQPLSASMAAALKLPKGQPGHDGALVAGVQPNSPAAHAGLQPGDLIVGIDGQKVATPRELAVDVAGIKPGTDSRLDVIRDGSQKTVDVTLATLSNTETAEATPASGEQHPSLGLSLAPLSPDMRDQLGVPAGTRGAVVAQVAPGSAADQAGLRQGDIVVGVGTRSVSSPDQAVNAIHEAENGSSDLALRIMRDGHAAFVAVPVPHGSHNGGDQNGDQDDNG
jgi:serine protease Do